MGKPDHILSKLLNGDIIDPTFGLVLLFSIIVMLGLYSFIYKITASSTAPINLQEPIEPQNRVLDDLARVRHGRNIAQLEENEDSSDDEEEVEGLDHAQAGNKPVKAKVIGTKKRLKMERKQALQEYNRYQLEQQKLKKEEEKKKNKEIRKAEKVESEAEEKEEEAWEKYLEQTEAAEKAEYEAWKPSIVVESSGSDKNDRISFTSRESEVIAEVKRERVVLLEAMAARFQATTKALVEMLEEAVKTGKIEGIFDERGKFIHVTREERLRIAKIVNQRGRISIQDLTSEANRVISLEPSPQLQTYIEQ